MDAANALNRIVRELPRAARGRRRRRRPDRRAVGDRRQLVPGRRLPQRLVEWNGSSTATPAQEPEQAGQLEPITTGQLASRFAGSADLYGDDGRKPWHSVNFMVAHDGFTLRDLYACNGKNNNQAWPYGPSDGGEDNNNSWDQGGVASRSARPRATAWR
jgi:isoamylase